MHISRGRYAQDNYSKRLTDSEGFLHYMQKVKTVYGRIRN